MKNKNPIINGILLGLSFCITCLIFGFIVIKAGWQSTNPGSSNDSNLFINGTGNLTKDKWNSLVNKTQKNYQKKVLTDGDISFTTARQTLESSTITLTTKGNPVLVIAQGFTSAGGSSSAGMFFDIEIDGVRQSGSSIAADIFSTNAGRGNTFHITYLADGLTAGSHTFKLNYKSGVNGGTLYKSATTPLQFSVIEM